MRAGLVVLGFITVGNMGGVLPG